MTLSTPLAALASRLRGFFRPPPPPVHVLRHEWAGIAYSLIGNVREALASVDDPDLADVHRDALAHDAERGRLPSQRGVFWTLERVE